jgi:dTDP-4-amino-4,6-dideoxygalactose transaminase
MYKIPFHKYRLSIEEEKAVLRVLRSGWLTSGNEVAAFESEFSSYLGDNVAAAAVSSCTSALLLALLGLGLPEGSKVLLPSLTYVSDVLSIIHLGLVPVLLDISLDDYCVDVNEIDRNISNDVGAVLVVHYAGNPCEMNSIVELCKSNKVYLVEDCAHALETRYYGNKVGVYGDASVYSFYPNKNITTAEGGMIVSQDLDLIAKCRKLRNHGIDVDSATQSVNFTLRNYDIHEPGYKMNMNDLQASLGRVQLKSIHSLYEQRVKLFGLYRQFLDSDKVKVIFNNDPNVRCSHHLMPIEVDENKRERLIANLLESGVQPSLHFKPIHKFSFALNFEWAKSKLPNTEVAYKRQLSLPLYPTMEPEEVEYVCKIVNRSL